MSRDPFPLPPGDAGEPDGCPLPPAAEGEREDWDGPAEQGLYVCLPAEQMTLSGFAQGGASDTRPPARCWPPSSIRSPARTARA
jgi:hypothetical protein